MRSLLIRLWIPTAMVATGCVADNNIVGNDTDNNDLRPGAGPQAGPLLPGGASDTLEFRVGSFAVPGTSPVAVALADGTRLYGYVDDAGQPYLTDGGGTRTQPPGTVADTTSIALASSRDGAVHVAWNPGDAIHYARRAANGSFGDAVVVAPDNAREPNLAIAHSGRVVVAYTRSWPDADEPRADSIMVAWGTVTQTGVVFGAADVANGECCVDEWAGPATAMSGPSLAIDESDSVHIVYEWSSFNATVVEYVHGDATGGYSTPLMISEAAFSPCPAINVDADGAHISYILDHNRDVWYVNVRDGQKSEPVSIYQADGSVQLALMARDGNGSRHLVVSEWVYGGQNTLAQVAYYPVPDPALTVHYPDPLVIKSVPDPGDVRLTPRAGGLSITPSGEILLTLERRDDVAVMGRAEAAISE